MPGRRSTIKSASEDLSIFCDYSGYAVKAGKTIQGKTILADHFLAGHRNELPLNRISFFSFFCGISFLWLTWMNSSFSKLL